MENESRKWGQPVQSCRLSISMTTLKTESGQPIQLTMMLRNDGASAIKIARSSLWFDYQYNIVDNEGREVPLTPFGAQQKENSMMAAIAVSELPPGQDWTSAVEISRLYDLRIPRKYRIEAYKELANPSGEGFFKVVSNSLEFEVISAK